MDIYLFDGTVTNFVLLATDVIIDNIYFNKGTIFTTKKIVSIDSTLFEEKTMGMLVEENEFPFPLFVLEPILFSPN